MRAASPLPAPHRPVRTRVACCLIMLGAAVAGALHQEATWLEPRFGTGELRAPRPPSWAVTSVLLLQGFLEGAILAALLLFAAEAARAGVEAVAAWGGRS